MSKAYNAGELAKMNEEQLDELIAGSCAHIPGPPPEDHDMTGGDTFVCNESDPWDPDEDGDLHFVYHEETEPIDDGVTEDEHWVCPHCGVTSLNDPTNEEEQ